MAVLTFATDFTSSVKLDNQLTGVPDSGFYWNRGVHPLVTVNNLLQYLPFFEGSFNAWEVGTTYGKYETTKSEDDIVDVGGVLYQSLTDSNIGNDPTSSPANWLGTNIESLVIKGFIDQVLVNMYSNLGLQKKLIEKQQYYNIGENTVDLTGLGDFIGWAFEARGSDYITINIDGINLQADDATPVNLYVVNQGQLLETIPITPKNGVMDFDPISISFDGFGRLLLLIDSREVITDNPYVDPLRFDSFVAVPIIGKGTAPEDAEISDNFNGNGLNFQISTRKNPQRYIEDNLINVANLLQVQFAIDFLQVMLNNPNSRSNRAQRITSDQINRSELMIELKNLEGLTVAKKYNQLLKETKRSIDRSQDTQIKPEKRYVMRGGTL